MYLAHGHWRIDERHRTFHWLSARATGHTLLEYARGECVFPRLGLGVHRGLSLSIVSQVPEHGLLHGEMEKCGLKSRPRGADPAASACVTAKARPSAAQELTVPASCADEPIGETARRPPSSGVAQPTANDVR